MSTRQGLFVPAGGLKTGNRQSLRLNLPRTAQQGNHGGMRKVAAVHHGHLPSNRRQRDRGLAASALPRLRDGSALHDHADPEAHTAKFQEAPFREGREHQDEGEKIKPIFYLYTKCIYNLFHEYRKL